MFSVKFTRFCLTSFLFLAVVVLTGCQNLVTRDRWDMICVGSTEKEEVKLIMGQPQEKPFKDLWWYYKKNKEAKIYFDDKGIVKAKKWIDMKSGDECVEPQGWMEK